MRQGLARRIVLLPTGIRLALQEILNALDSISNVSEQSFGNVKHWIEGF